MDNRADSMPRTGTDSTSTDRLRQQAGTVGEDLRELGRLSKDAAREKFEGAKHSAEEMARHARDRAVEMEGQLEDFVTRKPIQSLLMAAGAGVILGWWLSSRR
jgi:ElaB/YqjD/DUF883 family membrane-anchored ribosome-binding protein